MNVQEYFESFSKKIIKSNFIPSHSYPFHSLPLKLSNKGIGFPFLPLKLPNKGRKEYSKMILFIPFHSPPPNEALKKSGVGKKFYGHIDTHSKLKSDDVYNRKYKYKNTVGNL